MTHISATMERYGRAETVLGRHVSYMCIRMKYICQIIKINPNNCWIQ